MILQLIEHHEIAFKRHSDSLSSGIDGHVGSVKKDTMLNAAVVQT